VERRIFSHSHLFLLLRTVTFLNKSAMVWIGWGGLCDKETSDELNGAGESHESIGLNKGHICSL
jgi:hypothetical protein